MAQVSALMLFGQGRGAVCCDLMDAGPPWDSVGGVGEQPFPKVGLHGREGTKRHPKGSALEIWREIRRL